MHALRRQLARAATPKTTTTTTTSRLVSRPNLLRAMASKTAPDGQALDKNTPEAVWQGILTREEVRRDGEREVVCAARTDAPRPMRRR
jgi:hypothetical protein